MTHHSPCSDSNTAGPGGGAHSSSKAICPICYEDLKPLTEDLQSISVCGHVFHELCLQQWLEYCPAGKVSTCPICKQSCTPGAGGVTRLYFQSTGCAEPSHQQQQQQQTVLSEADAAALCGEISKLQGKLSAVGSALEAQKRHVDDLNGEILVWKERAKREEEMKNAYRKEEELSRHLLQIKAPYDLSKASEECARLQGRSLALAKELAALKLATDVNLGEDEIAKLASMGHGTKHMDAIDVLQRSLFLRNKSYKELMAQCNLLGRAETVTLKKLEKATEKISKLKMRLQELEKALEQKDTEILRDTKDLKGKRDGRSYFSSLMQSPDSVLIDGHPLEVQPGNSLKELDSYQISPSLPDKNVHFASVSGLQKSTKTYMGVSLPKNYMSGAEASSSQLMEMHQQSNPGDVSSNSRADAAKHGNDLDKNMDGNILNMGNPTSTSEAMVVHDDFGLAPFTPITKGSSVNDFSICSGDLPLPTKLNGSENANRYVGKWCKRTKATPTMHVSTGSGSLIAVGADGRAGRIKLLRTYDKLDGKTQSLWPKKCKYGTQGGQSQGCLRIEQFFGKI